MRATFAVAALVAAVSAQSYGPISQISDGQIQNPVTPAPLPTSAPAPVISSAAVSTPKVSVPAVSSPVVPPVVSTPVVPPVVSTPVVVPTSVGPIGTGVTPVPTVGTTGIFVNSTLATSATGAVSSRPAGGASGTPSASSPAQTGAAAVNGMSAFGFVAAIAAMVVA